MDAKRTQKRRTERVQKGKKSSKLQAATRNTKMRIVRNYKYIIIIIIVKRNPLHIKCYRARELQPNAKDDSKWMEWRRWRRRRKKQQPKRTKAGTESAKRNPRKRIRNIFYVYHKVCGKRMRFLTAILIACWFACFARITIPLKWTALSAAIIYLIWISHFMHTAYQKPY